MSQTGSLSGNRAWTDNASNADSEVGLTRKIYRHEPIELCLSFPRFLMAAGLETIFFVHGYNSNEPDCPGGQRSPIKNMLPRLRLNSVMVDKSECILSLVPTPEGHFV